MKSVCLIFQVHQPARLRRYRFFDIGSSHEYFDDQANETQIQKLARQCYLPFNSLLLRHIQRLEGRLKVAFYLSGSTLSLLERYSPDVIVSFRSLAETGCVEFLSGTWSNSLSCLENQEAFKEQVAKHRQSMTEFTGQASDVFYNTGLVYSDQIGASLSGMGFRGALTEGARQILGWKSPGALYGNPFCPGFKLLVRQTGLSDDLALRFSDQNKNEFPIYPGKYLSRILSSGSEEQLINIALEYETFGFFHPEKNGIYNFLDHFIFLAAQNPEICFSLPSEIFDHFQPVSLMHVPNPVSWNGEACDLNNWTGNDLQREALSKLYEFTQQITDLKDPEITRDWNFLQDAEHFGNMSTFQQPGFRPVSQNSPDPPFEAFINYMNILNDLRIRTKNLLEA